MASGMLGPQTMSALADMLRPPGEEDSDSDDEIERGPIKKMTPGDIGQPKPQSSAKDENEAKAPTKDIWEAEEVQEGAEFNDTHDPRLQPDYDIVYKQAISPEDMFLGMSNKNPTTSSCEDMVVKIQLPDTKGSDINLDVKKAFLDCRTSKYKLGLHLPHPVDHKTGKAQWDSKKEVLSVTLRMTREYDMLNF